MQRRGLRWEVDEPTEWQLRNKRWLADHPLATTVVGTVVFAIIGAGSADLKDFPRWLGALAGAVGGGVLGWGFSAENRAHVTRRTRATYAGATLVGILLLVVMKAL